MLKFRSARYTFILLVSCSPSVSLSKPQDVTRDILESVFLLKNGEQFGSSFTVEVENRQYLITAKHLVKGVNDGDAVEILHDGQWKSIRVRKLDTEPGEVDISVLVLPMQISPAHRLELGTRGLAVSQSTYFLGFPLGLRTDVPTLNRGFPVPLVKRALCAGFYTPGKYEVVFLDGVNNGGFSGGPVVF